MSLIPEELYYTKSHEWIRDNGDGTYSVGITDHAQELLGDIVFVELPEVGMSLDAGNESAVVESVKAASDVYSPIEGEVVAVNEDLDDAPETINESPYDGGWIFTVKADASVLDGLMNASDYHAVEDE